MSTTLQTEFRLIDINHQQRTEAAAEIKILKILLRKARGEKISLHDRWEITDLISRHPRLSEYVLE